MKTLTKLGIAMGGIVTMITLGATAALASPPPGPLDDVTTQANDAKATFATFVTGTAVPILFGLLVLGVGIALAVKYVRRGARAA